VTWVDPSGRLAVDTLPDTPDGSTGEVPAGTTRGGHTTAHWPVQAVAPELSEVK
jgi:hypothetical protein